MDRLEILRLATRRASGEVADTALSDERLEDLRKKAMTDPDIVDELAACFCDQAAYRIRNPVL